MSVPRIGHLNNRLLQKLDSLLPRVKYIRQADSSSVPLQWSQGQEDPGGEEPIRTSWDLLGMASAGPTPSTGRGFRGAPLCSLAFDGPVWSKLGSCSQKKSCGYTCIKKQKNNQNSVVANTLSVRWSCAQWTAYVIVHKNELWI